MTKATKQDALKMVLLRNAFYRDNYRRAVMALLLVLLINIGLIIGLVFEWTHPPKPQYFSATADGRIIEIHPLSDPVVTNQFVLQWATNAARRTYSWDFIHWQQNLQDASNYFTASGWKTFLAQLKASNNLNTLQKYHMVTDVTITGAPKLLANALIDGHYVWKISLPMSIKYTNGKKAIYQTAEVTLLVIREPVWRHPDRIAINNFIVNLQGVAGGQ